MNIYQFVFSRTIDFLLAGIVITFIASTGLILRDWRKQTRIDRLNKVLYGKDEFNKHR